VAAFENALPTSSAEEVLAFGKSVVSAEAKASAVRVALSDIEKTLGSIRTAIDRTPQNVSALEAQYAALTNEVNGIKVALNGLASRDQMGIKPASISSRLGYAMSATRSSYGPTQQHRDQLGYALEGLGEVSTRVLKLQTTELPAIQKAILAAKGPWTSGAPVAL
jgi:hypothetical protein